MPPTTRRPWSRSGRQLVPAAWVLERFRSGFRGKVSPVHFFWGSFHLACTRFSGWTAPRHPGGAPNCPDGVMVEGYSHELGSCGFWPGGGEEGRLQFLRLSRAGGFPRPSGTAGCGVLQRGAGQFLLPYEAVRTGADPDGRLLGFLRSSYAGAADLAGWDRAALEVDPTTPWNVAGTTTVTE